MRAMPMDARDLAGLDRIVHEPARLAVLACLAVVAEADFVFVQSQTGMTGGNLSSHVKKLDQAGYLTIHKEFQGNRPRTTLALTATGRDALTSYLDTLRSLLRVMDGAGS